MLYCGIDVGLEHHVCIKNEKGETLHKFKIKNTLEDFEKLESLIDKETQICLEDTGIYSYPIFEYFRRKGYDIKRVNGKRSKDLRDFFNKNMKTDLLDCEVLSKLRKIENEFCDEQVCYAKYEANDLKNFTRLYWKLRLRQTKLKKRIASYVFLICPELRNIFPKIHRHTLLLVLRHFLIRDIKNLSAEEIFYKMKEKSRSNVNQELIKKIKDCLANSVGIPELQDEHFFIMVDCYYNDERIMQQLNKIIASRVIASEYASLLSLKNISFISAGTLIGEIGDVDKFSNHKKFVKYCGLNFGRDQSGMKDKSFLGKSSTQIKFALKMVALCYIQDKESNKFKDFFIHLKNKNKHGRTCVLGAVRKIATWLYFEMKRRKHFTKEQNIDELKKVGIVLSSDNKIMIKRKRNENKEKKRECCRRHRQRYPGRYISYSRNYYKENREVLLQKLRAKRENNKDWYKMMNQRHYLMRKEKLEKQKESNSLNPAESFI